MAIISVSLPNEVHSKLNKLAQIERRPKSQVVSEAMHQYDLAQSWARIRREGDKIAKRLGIETDDDVERIFG